MVKFEAKRRRTCKNDGMSPLGVGRAAAAGLGLLLFAFLLPAVTMAGPGTLERPAATLPVQPSPAVTGSPEPEPAALDGGRSLNVYMADGSVEALTLEDYLWGVVAAEMPASFEPAALEAQTVAARTYALSKAEGEQAAHPGAAVCTDITCCQAYVDREEALAGWGEDGTAYAQKIAAAVAATDGLVLTYEGELIDAVFHSSSQSSTVDAVEVWGRAVPYLVGVETPEAEGDVPNFYSVVSYTGAEFAALMTAAWPEADLSGAPSDWFGTPELSPSGVVAQIEIGGVTLTGAEVRALCDLRSARFAVAADDTSVVFSVAAYGHGVGMSQYGAQVMAGEGAGFEEILTHYYTGAVLTPMAR